MPCRTLNHASNYRVIPNTNALYDATPSSHTPRPSASPPSTSNPNKVPARLRQTSGGFHSPHVNATTSYQAKKNVSHHQRHHGHHKGYYQNYYQNSYQTHKKQKQKCSVYKTNKKHNIKAEKNLHDPTAIDLTTRKDDDSDNGTGQDAEGSDTSDFGLRKVGHCRLLHLDESDTANC